MLCPEYGSPEGRGTLLDNDGVCQCPAVDGQILVALPSIVAAKLALYTAMRRQGINNVALAKRLGLSESAVRRLVNPHHRSHISSVEAALRAIGRGLVVGDRAVA